MQFKNIKKQTPKKIRNHLYSVYEINPETNLSMVNERITAKSFEREYSASYRARKLILAVKDANNASVIFRPNDRKTGFYPVCYVVDGKLHQTAVHTIADVKKYTNGATLYTATVFRRPSFRYAKPVPFDVLQIKTNDRLVDIEQTAYYWSGFASKRASDYIQRAKEKIVSRILSLDSYRDESGNTTTYRNQRLIALEEIVRLEKIQTNPYAVAHLGEINASSISPRHVIGLRPYVIADESVRRVKSMIHKNTLARLKQ